jgi:hypothetical protein
MPTVDAGPLAPPAASASSELSGAVTPDRARPRRRSAPERVKKASRPTTTDASVTGPPSTGTWPLPRIHDLRPDGRLTDTKLPSGAVSHIRYLDFGDPAHQRVRPCTDDSSADGICTDNDSDSGT